MSFKLCFSPNYEVQHKEVLDLLKASFSLMSDAVAKVYHSIISFRLMKLSARPQEERKISFQVLKRFVEGESSVVFQTGYFDYLETNKYEKIIRERYFVFKAINLNKFERIFIIECDEFDNEAEIIEVITIIKTKYFRKNKSPQPYIFLRGISRYKERQVKRELERIGFRFFDGTSFDGGDCNKQNLIKSYIDDDQFCSVKFIRHDLLDYVLESGNIKEIYEFFISEPSKLLRDSVASIKRRERKIQVKSMEQIVRIINK